MTSLENALRVAEEAERDLSYFSVCRSEKGRKDTGSYYTPADVAEFFWREFFLAKNISTSEEYAAFVSRAHFVEPSAGAGALVFALLLWLARKNVHHSIISSIKIDIVDINSGAISFIKKHFRYVSTELKSSFRNVKFHCADFRDICLSGAQEENVIFGNPPFVANREGASPWKNLFADFLERALRLTCPGGDVHLILPISIAFSRDYARLRAILRSDGRRIVASHFDNIPDTLFKSGKPQSTNTNKANSQRCSILSIVSGGGPAMLSSKLQRWSRFDRAYVLEKSPNYIDVSRYTFDDQIPRPFSNEIIGYLESAKNGAVLGELVDGQGEEVLYVAAIARNFIGIRETGLGGAHRLAFKGVDDFFRGMMLVASDLFMAYWLTVGDGFHLTKANLHQFPVNLQLWSALEKRVPFAKHLWADRFRYSKNKLNAGRNVESFDFSAKMPSLLAQIADKA